jgi:hypothetical protein
MLTKSYFNHPFALSAMIFNKIVSINMNKMIRIVYSVLKNSKAFEIITPEDQEKQYKTASKLAA